MKILIHLLYFSMLCTHVVAGLYGSARLEEVTKPALCALLFVLLLSGLGWQLRSAADKQVALALLASLAGDVFLQSAEAANTYFMWGLLCFLSAHLLYTISFASVPAREGQRSLLQLTGIPLIAIAGYAFLFYRALLPYLHDMAFPVLGYTVVISLMLVFAFNRWKKVSQLSFILVAGGAVLFVVSDSILAWNRFVQPVSYSSLWIMSTYGLAQWAIVSGHLAGHGSSLLTVDTSNPLA